MKAVLVLILVCALGHVTTGAPPPDCSLVRCAQIYYCPYGHVADKSNNHHCCWTKCKPNADPKGQCPKLASDAVGICLEQCYGDSCGDGQLCCSNGCGNVCMDADRPGKRSCIVGGPPSTVYHDGDKYNDGCNTCTCTDGVVSCTEMACI